MLPAKDKVMEKRAGKGKEPRKRRLGVEDAKYMGWVHFFACVKRQCLTLHLAAPTWI